MSEMVHYTGKIAPVGKLPNETLEEQCKRISAEHNYFELDGYCDSWSEMLCDKLYERYVIACGEVYKVIEKNHKGIDDDIFNAQITVMELLIMKLCIIMAAVVLMKLLSMH